MPIQKTSYKLFIPGPVDVSEATYTAMARGLIGHRSAEFAKLYNFIQAGLQPLMGSRDPAFLMTTSAWGGMEAAVINCAHKKVLNCMSGAFSDKWHEVCLQNGINAQPLQVPWGEPITPEIVRAKLQEGGYDAITIVHNETSTGTQNPLEDILKVVREFPEVISIVDTVSSFAGVPLYKDAWGADIIVTGVQKALALPPGLAIVCVSERALKRAGLKRHRGYYLDFLEYYKNHEKGMTPTTPCISIIYGLEHQLKSIEAEGVEGRFKRHEELNRQVHAWGKEHGFKLFPQAAYASKTLTCFENTQGLDLLKINEALKQQYHMVIDTGYGKLKGKTFRISNMGNETKHTMAELLDSLDIVLSNQ